MIAPVTSDNRSDFISLLDKFLSELNIVEKDEIIYQSDTYNSFIAYDRDKPIGIASATDTGSHLIGQVLWVDPEYRKTNIGGLLYRKLCQINKNATRTIFVKPERLPLYEKLGYTVEYLVLKKE